MPLENRSSVMTIILWVRKPFVFVIKPIYGRPGSVSLAGYLGSYLLSSYPQALKINLSYSRAIFHRFDCYQAWESAEGNPITSTVA